jgi:predicted GIY-YIG superfamily endonuclease
MKPMNEYTFPLSFDDFSMDRTPTIQHPQVYILELNNGKYYVGHAVDIYRRLRNHNSNSGSIWTKLHGVKSILAVTDGTHDDENRITIETMHKYAYQNVRGGKWYQEKLKGKPVELIALEQALVLDK